MPNYICESTWHVKYRLNNFEQCPLCNSTAYHLVVNDDLSEVIFNDE